MMLSSSFFGKKLTATLPTNGQKFVECTKIINNSAAFTPFLTGQALGSLRLNCGLTAL